jgi:thiamine kinase-like enzyme
MQQPQPDLSFLTLLDHLTQASDRANFEWRCWRVARVGGGGNNILYHATNYQHDLAVKLTIRDDRDRAGREYAALLALQRAGLAIAPAPVWLDRQRYAQPVVVQTWLAGDIVSTPPDSDQEWSRLLDHYLVVHCITPATTSVPLQLAVLNMRSAADGLGKIRQQLARIPRPEQPPALRELLRQVEGSRLPEWPAPDLALCRVDPNTLNFVRRAGAWASVDWENSGWGDPVYEIADLMTHPSYAAVPAARWDWLIDAYCARRTDPTASTRIRVYYMLMLIWWAARLARMLYEVPRGGDQRLAGRPGGWMQDASANYERYLALAQQVELGSDHA